jgi:predicted negative regulator of RcsB-dependent stress response
VARVLAEADRLGDADLRDRAILADAQELFFLGQTSSAMQMIDRLADRVVTMPRRVRADVGAQLVVNAYFGSVAVEEGFAVLDRAVPLRGDGLAAVAHDLRVRGALLGMAGRFEEARASFAEADSVFDELGAPMVKVTTSQVVAETLRLEGRLVEAERVLRSMYEAYSSIGETGFNSTVCAVLAHVLCDQGRFDEAEGFAQRSREMASADDFASQAAWRSAMARVESERGRSVEALALVDEAIEIESGTDYLDWQGQELEVRGNVLADAGRGDEARAAFGDALDRFERKGNVVAAARVRERIEALATG